MEIKFQNIFPNEIVGKVNGLEHRLLDERSPAGVGGIYTHYAPALIVLSKQNNTYHILFLSLFDYQYGWCDVIENGEYATPRNFSSDEEDDIGR